jgi:hypothetical protein
MWRHAKACWGEEAIKTAQKARSAQEARTRLRGNLRNGSITAASEKKDKEEVSYSHRQHTKTETRYSHVYRV